MILTFWAIIIQSHLVILATDGGLKSQHIVVRMPCEISNFTFLYILKLDCKPVSELLEM